MGNKTLAVAGVVVAIFAGLLIFRALTRPSDETLIQEALAESIKASREGRAGGVMDLLSQELRVNDIDPGTRAQIARMVREWKPDVEVVDPTPLVTGDEARIVSDVDLKIGFIGPKIERRIPEVTLLFRRETGREWLVLPADRWRLYRVFAPPEATQDFLQ
jgi:hypothetical protein